jgi:glycosyltransferase involved in cell wall biosynthesis
VDVSVIIRTKDRPILLSRALHSLSLQTSRNFEVVIINDGGDAEPISTLLSDYSLPEVVVVNNEESIGRAKAFNKGLYVARGKLVACLDDDDTFEPEFIEQMTAFAFQSIAHDPKVGGVVCRCLEIYEELLATESGNYRNYPANIKMIRTESLFAYNSAANFISPYFYYIQRENFLPVQAVFLREVLIEFGGFAEANDVLEDRPLYYKVLSKYKVAVLQECLANHHTRVTAGIGTNANSMHDNATYEWGKRFAEFYNDGYYRDHGEEAFFFSVMHDAQRDMRWELQSDRYRRQNLNAYIRMFWRQLGIQMLRHKAQWFLVLSLLSIIHIVLTAIAVMVALHLYS